jgi:hypothetical protein
LLSMNKYLGKESLLPCIYEYIMYIYIEVYQMPIAFR